LSRLRVEGGEDVTEQTQEAAGGEFQKPTSDSAMEPKTQTLLVRPQQAQRHGSNRLDTAEKITRHYYGKTLFRLFSSEAG